MPRFSTEKQRMDPFLSKGEEGVSTLSFQLPIRTYSEANGLLSATRKYKNGKAKPEHWTEKAERHKSQKLQVLAAMNHLRGKIPLPCTIKLTRYAPRFLDWHDNLPISFKWILDQVCDIIRPGLKPGHADDDERITIKYDQVKTNEYSIMIEVISNL